MAELLFILREYLEKNIEYLRKKNSQGGMG
jgi:hypothetical protein